jgi:hypothetical protein
MGGMETGNDEQMTKHAMGRFDAKDPAQQTLKVYLSE